MTGRLAVNPIAYWLRDDVAHRTTAVLAPALTELAAIGYRAVKADVPDDLPATDYLSWLDSFGLAPALSLFSGTFDDPAERPAQVEAARRFAAAQAGFGLHHTMISTVQPPDGVRRRRPAVGADPDPALAAAVVDGIGACAAAMRAEGVTAALHPHVGGRVETEAELRTVLDDVGADLLAFGPDTGHLAWAGMDVPAVLRDYADRIVGIHLKDVFSAGIDAARREGLSYAEATVAGRLWAEPGLGQIDLAACVAALPDAFTGDWMIEIDVPSLPRRAAHVLAHEWACATLPLATT